MNNPQAPPVFGPGASGPGVSRDEAGEALPLDDPDRDAGTLYMDLWLRPPKSFVIARHWPMFAFVAFAFVVHGLVAFRSGAWPVALALAGAVVVSGLCWYRFERASRIRQVLRLTDTGLGVWHITPRGRVRRWSLNPWWLRVSVANTRRDYPGVWLINRRDVLVVGEFLPPSEREEVADLLRSALFKLRARRNGAPLS